VVASALLPTILVTVYLEPSSGVACSMAYEMLVLSKVTLFLGLIRSHESGVDVGTLPDQG
jgi:hypothetical protein